MKKAKRAGAGKAERKAAPAGGQQAADPAEELLRELFGGGALTSRNKSTRDIAPLLTEGARLPMEYWGTGWVFLGVEDLTWRSITADAFPATLREDHKTHPGYVLREIGNYGVEMRPMTSHPWNRKQSRYIPKGARLDVTGYEMDRDSYLVERAVSRLPRSGQIFGYLPSFIGVYPPEKLS